ncbi:hypothetical protein N665_0201s0004 [Sinapis alba]|nr:hypothetical protein N665_0201s0004 [Sinapis alba]
MPQPGAERNESDLAIMLMTALIFSFFIVGLASVCYRWTSRRFYTVEQSVSLSTHSEHELRIVRRVRTNTAARGIDAAIVNSFQTFLYSEVKEQRIGNGGVECVVCLCEFQDDDTLSLMPNCCHVYHSSCVNVWLSDHSTCPLCRVDLVIQPGEGSEPDLELGVVDLSESMTWRNWSRQLRSRSLRSSYSRVSDISFSRSHSTGYSVAEPVENLDRFTLRLPDDVLRQLTKKMVRSSRGLYRSRSVGSERNVFSELWCNYKNNRRIRSMTFSFADHCLWSGGDVVAPPNSERSSTELRPDDIV